MVTIVDYASVMQDQIICTCEVIGFHTRVITILMVTVADCCFGNVGLTHVRTTKSRIRGHRGGGQEGE